MFFRKFVKYLKVYASKNIVHLYENENLAIFAGNSH